MAADSRFVGDLRVSTAHDDLRRAGPEQAPRVRVSTATVTFMPLSSRLTSQAKDQLRALLKGRKVVVKVTYRK